jgi:penicillin-binding protein 1B
VKSKRRKSKRRVKKVRARRPWLKFLFWSSVLAILGAIAAYVAVDRKVAAQLRRSQPQKLSAVYSDTVTIGSESGLAPEQLTQRLSKLRYTPVLKEPQVAGEYNLSASTLKIFTREFVGADGTFHPAAKLQVENPGRPGSVSFSLEPQIVAVLGGGETRASEVKNLNDFPEQLKNAVLAIEDERFYRHHGLDLQGILRALLQDLKAMRIVQGGSTITQQLAKNLFFSPERSLSRKLMEALAALSLEQHLDKDKILELYLNEIYLGQEGSVAIHGFGEAAKTYFGKRVEDLSLDQAALLAGVIKAPSFYSPRWHGDRAKERRDTVLTKMRELGYIDAKQLTSALNAKTEVIAENLHQRKAPFYTVELEQHLASQFNLEAAVLRGIGVYTGLDLEMQDCAETALRQGLENAEKNYTALRHKDALLEAGLVSIEPFSGKIRAWVGGREYGRSQFDHVSQAKRQIGSTIKPFLYITALDSTLNNYKVATATSILSDRPMTIDLPTHTSWEPENYDRSFRGDVTLRYALENSLNLPAVYTAQKFGFQTLARTAMKFHVAENIKPMPALALGAEDTTLLDLTGAFAALANAGIYVAPRDYIAATTLNNEQIALSSVREEQVADENAVYVLTNIMQGVIDRGTGKIIRKLGYQGPVAGKTGTSNDTRDAWFVGFTPDLATGVWVGYDDNRKTGYTGGVLAAPIWAEYMKCVAQFRAPLDFVAPSGVIFEEIDSQSGQLAVPECPRESVIHEVFVRGTEPLKSCRLHSAVQEEQPPSFKDLPAEPKGRRSRKESFWDRLFDW